MLLTLRAAHLVERIPGVPTTVELPGGRAHLVHPAGDVAAVVLEAEDAPGAEFPSPGQRSCAGLLGHALAAFLPALAGGDEVPREFEARISALWSPTGEAVVRRLFEPLGYAVEAIPIPLDPAQPLSGRSGYWTWRFPAASGLATSFRTCASSFPFRPPPAFRAPGRLRGAVGRGTAVAGDASRARHGRANLLARASRRGLHDLRHDAVLAALRESGARRVLDLGCGTGTLLRRLLEEPGLEEVVGVEVVLADLAVARQALPPGGRGRVLHGSLAYRDARLAGYDAAALVEVIEHMDPAQLAACEGVVWEAARPATVVVTTPNAEYNALLGDARHRHPDHRFEWTRAEFRAWADGVASRHGYEVRYAPAGPEDPRAGPVTQMAVFDRLAGTPDQPAGPPEEDGRDASGDDARSVGNDGGISLEDVAGEQTIDTRRGVSIQVGTEETAAALEAMSRFAVDPRWLIHLPASTPDAPMPGGEAAEQPAAAMAFYRSRGVRGVALEELHAGTRAVAVVCRDARAARCCFRVAAGETGVVYTSLGQPFFATRAAEEAFLARLRGALDAGGVWEEMRTEWIALEGVIEGMPVFREVNPASVPRPPSTWPWAPASGRCWTRRRRRSPARPPVERTWPRCGRASGSAPRATAHTSTRAAAPSTPSAPPGTFGSCPNASSPHAAPFTPSATRAGTAMRSPPPAARRHTSFGNHAGGDRPRRPRGRSGRRQAWWKAILARAAPASSCVPTGDGGCRTPPPARHPVPRRGCAAAGTRTGPLAHGHATWGGGRRRPRRAGVGVVAGGAGTLHRRRAGRACAPVRVRGARPEARMRR